MDQSKELSYPGTSKKNAPPTRTKMTHIPRTRQNLNQILSIPISAEKIFRSALKELNKSKSPIAPNLSKKKTVNAVI